MTTKIPFRAAKFLLAVSTAALLFSSAAADTADTIAQNDPVFAARVRQVLLDHPEILLEVMDLLEQGNDAALRPADTDLIAAYADRLFGTEDESAPVLVEFFDYRCGYCRMAAPEVAALRAANPGLRVVLRQYPILGDESRFLAEVVLGVREVYGEESYLGLHDTLIADTGEILSDLPGYLERLGYELDAIETAAQSEAVQEDLAESFALARGLQIAGTPAFVTRTAILRSYADRAELTAALERP